MGFWTIVGAVIVAHLILGVVRVGVAGLAKWAERKVADKQLEDIRNLADFIVKNQK